MKFTKKDIDKLNATVVMEIAPADYQEKVSKKLKDARKKVQMPGFRPGMVPAGLVRKMYGTNLLAETLNDLIGEELYKYLEDQKLNILGEPISNDTVECPQLNLDVDNTYLFAFDIAVAPEFKLDLKKEVPSYEIEISDQMVQEQVDAFAGRFGEMSEGETVQENDVLNGVLTQVGGDIVKENVSLSPSVMKQKTQQKKFLGAKKDDIITFNPKKAFANEAELASMLQIDKEIAKDIENDFTYQITNIRHFEKAQIDQKLFDKVYGEGAVKSEEEFRARVKAGIQENMDQDQAYRFGIDAKQMILKQLEGLAFPEDFLKRWLKMQDKEGKMTDEELDKDFPKMLDDLKWHLAKDQIAKEAKAKVEDEDVKNYARMMTRMQFMQYGITGVADDMIEQYAQETLKNRDQVRGIIDRCLEEKVFAYVKTQAKLKNKKISYENFGKLFEDQK